MLAKPSSCQGCPLFQDGQGFVPDDIRGRSVAILAQNPGADEERGMRIVGYAAPRNPLYERTDPRPLIGATGWMLKHTYLPLAGLQEEDCDYYNVLKCRWNHANELPKGKVYEQAVKHCTEAHLKIHPQTTLLIAHGAAAWEFTQGKDYSISDWRGFLGPRTYQGIPVYATLHAADCLRDPHARFIARFDWKRVAKIRANQWPKPVPHRVVASPATRREFVDCLEEALCQPEIMVDTEFIPDKKLMTHVGAAWKSGNAVRGFQVEWLQGSATSIERAIFTKYWSRLCEKTCMGFWNAKADLPILEANLGHTPCRFEDPMQAHAVLWPDMEHSYEFVASIYGHYNKLKHLSKDDILLYHWGDMIDLVWIWEALKDELKQDPHAERKYREQNLPLLPILLERERQGIRINREAIGRGFDVYRGFLDRTAMLATAYCGYPINLGSASQLPKFLATQGLKFKSIDQDTIAQARAKYLPFDSDYESKHGLTIDNLLERVDQGAHPLLELRVMYANAKQIVSHYLEPMQGLDRCYPSINIHTQAGGRHSTTNPPLATLPNDLRNLVLPDEGFVWIGWDWDQQEPRIQRAESGSRVLGAAFDRGEDIHTTFVCQLYGWQLPRDRRDPHHSTVDADWRRQHGWMGKDDPRRVFAKTTRYEINYGGTGEQAAKKAVRMGIEPGVAKRAAQVLLQSDPELAAWFRKVERQVEQTRMVHSWDGGRRVWYWVDTPEMAKKMKREARNFPPQGGGAGLYNLVIVEIAQRVPKAKFVFGMHDSQYWQILPKDLDDVFPTIKQIATQPRVINGMQVPFPASFKLITDQGVITKL